MAELPILFAVFKEYGIEGVIIGFLFIYHFVWPQYKKKRGKWFSYTDAKDRMNDLETRVAELKVKVDGNFESNKTLLEAEMQHNFQQHAEIFRQIRELEKK